MKATEIYKFFNELSEDAFNLIYLGEFDDNLTAVFLQINEASKSEVKSYKKKISFLIAECFQNIIRHTDDDIEEKMMVQIPRMFMLRDKGQIHHIVTTNLIQNNQIDKLTTSLESLKNLSKEELKEIYLTALSNNQRTAKGGAGLGLIEMARRSGNVPSFEFVPIDENYSNFFMQVYLAPKGYEGVMGMDDQSVSTAKLVYGDMIKNNIILVQKGDFSQDAIVPLIHLFESNLAVEETNLVFKKKALYILIEMLQNITRHSNLKDGIKQGILIVSKSESGVYELSTGNYISNNKSDILKEELTAIAGLSKIELTKKYKTQLKSPQTKEGEGAGIGLIEISRNSNEPIDFEIIPVNDEISFFSLNVKL